MDTFDKAVEGAMERNDNVEDYLRWKTGAPIKFCDECEHSVTLHDPKEGCTFERGDAWVDGESMGGYVAQGPCGCTAVAFEDEFQALLEKYWTVLQKGLAATLLLLALTGVSRADSLTEQQVVKQLEQGVIPLAVGVGDVLADNLLAAQVANISYTANEPTSLQLSINAVLKAIGIYVWPGGPTLITDQRSEPIVWAQSTVAVDTGASVTLWPTSIDFGETPISTPEPSTLLLLLPIFGLLYYRTPKPSEVERAADVLGMGEPERTQMYAFYHRERTQNRDANIKLLKAIFRVLFKSAVVLLVLWALFQTWTERLPR